MMTFKLTVRQALGACLMLASSVAASAQSSPQDLPRFSSAVDVASVDASVFDSRGQAVTDLKPEEFTVRVDGSARRVVSAEWIPLVTSDVRPAPPPPPEGYSSNGSVTGGRLIMIVVDQPNIRFGGTSAIRNTINQFIDRLESSDRAAVIGIGPGSPATSFTADKARLKQAVERMTGQYVAPIGQMYSISVSEAADIRDHVVGTLDAVVNRECASSLGLAASALTFDICASEIERQAREMALDTARTGQETLTVLRNLLTAVKAIDAPKTLVFVSEGFIADNQQATVNELGALAGAARTTIYALKLDDLLNAAAAEARAPLSRMADRAVRSEGLDLLAASSRGASINVMGSGSNAFERIASELTGYYLLAVESADSDRDGRAH
ncbi:MAG: VWA domain-containing protein, partial [Acidobacteriaceae bacterium]|nr:VWA domain-containing protein [Acidobacteriaceae bacterium]